MVHTMQLFNTHEFFFSNTKISNRRQDKSGVNTKISKSLEWHYLNYLNEILERDKRGPRVTSDH